MRRSFVSRRMKTLYRPERKLSTGKGRKVRTRRLITALIVLSVAGLGWAAPSDASGPLSDYTTTTQTASR